MITFDETPYDMKARRIINDWCNSKSYQYKERQGTLYNQNIIYGRRHFLRRDVIGILKYKDDKELVILTGKYDKFSQLIHKLDEAGIDIHVEDYSRR